MDLHTALISADKSKARPAYLSQYQEIFFDGSCSERPDNEFEKRVKDLPVYTWWCTDTEVGLYAILMDNEVIGWHWQPGRKFEREYRFFSRLHAEYLRRFIELCIVPEDTLALLVASGEEIYQELPAQWNLNTVSTKETGE
jgi:hypothetical protein